MKTKFELEKSIAKISIKPDATFTVILSKTTHGETVIKNARCEMSYHWNFSTNTGLAHLKKIDDCSFDIVLHPMGIKGVLGFISDISPTSEVINGQILILNRIILRVDLKTGEPSAGIMFNQNGSCFETTANWHKHIPLHLEFEVESDFFSKKNRPVI